MAHYANAKAGVPFHKREEERRWNEHLKKHQKSISAAKPTLPVKKKTNEVSLNNARKLRQERERLLQIEYENKVLLEKIGTMERRRENKNQENMSTTPRSQTSANEEGRKQIKDAEEYEKELEEIEKKNEERIAENVRLNKKLKEIKEGKGKIKVTDPDYDPQERWWITSPRPTDKAMIDREAEKLRAEIHEKRKEEEIKREREEKRIVKKLEEEQERIEEEKNGKQIPDGYHQKLRKKKKTTTFSDHPPDNETNQSNSSHKEKDQSHETNNEKSNQPPDTKTKQSNAKKKETDKSQDNNNHKSNRTKDRTATKKNPR